MSICISQYAHINDIVNPTYSHSLNRLNGTKLKIKTSKMVSVDFLLNWLLYSTMSSCFCLIHFQIQVLFLEQPPCLSPFSAYGFSPIFGNISSAKYFAHDFSSIRCSRFVSKWKESVKDNCWIGTSFWRLNHDIKHKSKIQWLFRYYFLDHISADWTVLFGCQVTVVSICKRYT